MMKLKKGFTLIELLVVIAIIALLSTLAVVSLNSTRAKSRDAKRVSDIKQVQTALELYYASATTYPAESAGVTLGDTAAATCLGNLGFGTATGTGTNGCGNEVYMGQVPADPLTTDYVYTSDGGAAYTIAFELEGQTGSLSGTAHTASESGIQ